MVVQEDVRLHDESIPENGAEPEEPREKRERVKCAWCRKRFTEPFDRRRHEKEAHPKEFSAREKAEAEEKAAEAAREAAEKEAEEFGKKTGGVDYSTLSERGKEFVQALEGAGLLETGKGAGLSQARRKQLIINYEEESDQLCKNKQALENLLGDYGLHQAQIRMMVRRVIKEPYADAQATAQPQAFTMDSRTGQLVPIIIQVPQGASSPQYPGAPIIIPQPAAQERGFSREDAENLFERMADRLEDRLDKRPEPVQPPTSINIRRYQQPVFDAEGQPVLGPNGVILMAWVEEPIDQLNATLAALSNLGLFNREPASVPLTPTIEEIKAAVKGEAAVVSPEMTALQTNFQALLNKLDKDDAVKEAVEATTNRMFELVSPYLDSLKTSSVSPGGLTDVQAELHHTRGMTKDMLDTFQNFYGGVRDDIKPLFLTAAVGNLKRLGMSDDAISKVLISTAQAAAQEPPDVMQQRRRSNRMRQWVREEE